MSKVSLGKVVWWTWRKCTRRDQSLVGAWMAYKGSKEAQSELALCDGAAGKQSLEIQLLLEGRCTDL